MRWMTLLTALIPITLGACASTTIKQNPGPHDKGIRYYRPKPYLVIKKAKESPEKFVDLSVEYLPDFTEEYSIHVRTGIGKNKTSVKLDQGWNLTAIDIDIDSEIPENIKAVSELISSVGKIGRPSSEEKPTLRVAATNVPIGYYESVISRGPDGKKRLYCWRYVGFGPLSSCPVETTGLECGHCDQTPIFALLMRDGVMSFVPLYEVPARPVVEKIVPEPSQSVHPLPAAVEKAYGEGFRELPQEVAKLVNQELGIQPASLQVTASDVHACYVPSDSATVVIRLPEPYYSNLKDPARSALDQRISTKIGNLMGSGSFVSRIFYDKR